ncbi:MAG: FAD-dependent thymidylate synthase [Candidatus Pacearchaeota archaeon]|nr:FAD-dependent thymidylate synthase [Candidatus Pacearchaeota archaeon]
MEIQLVGSTNNLIPEGLIPYLDDFDIPEKPIEINRQEIYSDIEDLPDKEQIIESLYKFSQTSARVCYSKYNFQELLDEVLKKGFLDGLIERGHHSVFEHINFNFYLDDFSKMFVMVLNNEKQYATSEKSARYTEMTDIQSNQKLLYEKWKSIFQEEITKKYSKNNFGGLYIKGDDGKTTMEKLAQENARYMTSVFTPTKMVYTLNWRQLNFLMSEFEKFQSNPDIRYCGEELGERVVDDMKEFNRQLAPLRIDGLENQTDRRLSAFDFEEVENSFKYAYSTNYEISFAGWGQFQRHRTIDYHTSDGTDLGANLGFFVPRLIRRKNLETEWIKDLESVAQTDFPQGQLIRLNEYGNIKDFRSKWFLRVCGHAQNEAMEVTVKTGKKYKRFQKKYGDKSLEPKCIQGYKCVGTCVWKGKKALSRLI